MQSCSEDHRQLLRAAFGTRYSPPIHFDAGYTMTSDVHSQANGSPRRISSEAKRSPVSPKATHFAHDSPKRRRSETADSGAASGSGSRGSRSGSGSQTMGGSPQLANGGRRATLADLGSQAPVKPSLEAKTSFERGGADREESSPVERNGDVDMDANDDEARSPPRSPRDGQEDGRSHRPSLPGIKHLFTLAGSAGGESSRPDSPGFPTLSALQGPLMSRSSVSSDVSGATSSGRLSRLSSFQDERLSFSTSVSSGVPSANQPTPGVAGWWGREKDDGRDVALDEATDFARKRSYAAFAANLEAKAAAGRSDRNGEVASASHEAEQRRWSDMAGHAQQETHARANRTHSYPVATREQAPRELPSPSFKRPSNSPLKWSTIREGQPLPSPISPTHGTMTMDDGRRPSVLQDPASAQPSFVSPFSGSGLPSSGLQHPQPQPMAVRTLSGASEMTERESVQRWREGMDPAEPYPHLPVQRSRSGPTPMLGEQERRSSAHRVHPYDRERDSRGAGRYSADHGAPVMGPYDQQQRKGSVQHGPELHKAGSPFRWNGYEGPGRSERPIHSADAAGRWSSFGPPRGEQGSRAWQDDRRQSQVDPKARLSPADGPPSSIRGTDDPSRSPRRIDPLAEEARRRSEDTTGRYNSGFHRPAPLDHRGSLDSWHPRSARETDDMPSVLRPAPPSISMPGHPQRSASDYSSSYDVKAGGERSGQYQPIRVYPAAGMPTAELPRPISSNENGPQGPGEHGTIVNGPNGPRYICNFCGKTFTRPSSLRIHTYSHTGERPYVCNWPNCGRSFSVQSNLKRHAKTHTMAGTPPGDSPIGLHPSDGHPMDLARRHSYDVVSSNRAYGGAPSPGYGPSSIAPERVPSDGPGRMSLGSIMDAHSGNGHGPSARHHGKMQGRREINLDEDEEEEEDELADELEDERREVAV